MFPGAVLRKTGLDKKWRDTDNFVRINLVAISYIFLYNIYKEQNQAGEQAVARLLWADVPLPILYIQNICRSAATGKKSGENGRLRFEGDVDMRGIPKVKKASLAVRGEK